MDWRVEEERDTKEKTVERTDSERGVVEESS